ncbi:hypothetical protein V5799_032320 [Amblyomma americanum]|uniref:Kelch domain-containing protein 3 n=1 Tax=Amblyomma americanum TaxID=6943 RepID=A0AAQ4DRI0_AMBAM
MYVFGGFEEDGISREVHSLDLETMQWQQVLTTGRPPLWRFYHSASAIGDRMYVWGGEIDVDEPYGMQSNTFSNSIAFLDTVTSCWEHPSAEGTPPMGRRGHAAFEYKGQLYIFGGHNEDLKRNFGDIHKYDPMTSCWSPVKIQKEGPCARRGPCCCIVGDRLFVFGGRSPEPVQRNGQHVDEQHAAEEACIEHSDLHILDFAPTLKTPCFVAIIEARLDFNNLPQYIKREISAMTPSKISRPFLTTG